MVDSTDFLPTFTELAGAKLPENKIIDGRSIASQLRGLNGKERDWIFIELGNQWYVREEKWKLNQSGQLFDMSNSPFEEKLVEINTESQDAIAARKRLQSALDGLNPAGGILDDGDGSGRHQNKKKEKGKKKQMQSESDKDKEE
jgi:arylsulfatase A